MKLRIEYTGQLRTAIGCAHDELEVRDGMPLGEMLCSLATRLSDTAASHVLTAAGELQSGLLVVVNGAAIPAAAAQATILKSGDEITLLPPIAGG